MGWRLVLTLLLIARVAGAADEPDLCLKAGQRYVQCVEEVLGSGAAATARDGLAEGVAGCRGDEKTRAMYRGCLPQKDCQAFMGCLQAHIARTRGPSAAAGLPKSSPRRAQCQAHVEEGLRGVALQIVMMGEGRTRPEKIAGRNCVFDESRPVRECLNDAERSELKRYGQQRQRDCEAWPAPLAACILGLEGAKDCNPDEYPFWRAPLDQGPPGPPVVWQISIKPAEYPAPQFTWLKGGRLVVADQDGLRAVRAGKELWRAEARVKQMDAFGRRLITWAGGGGLRVWDARTGKPRATILKDEQIVAIAPSGVEILLALLDDGRLVRIRPEVCKGTRTGCARPAGRLPEDLLSHDADLIQLAGPILVLSGEGGLDAFDEKRKHLFSLELTGSNEIDRAEPAGPHHLAIVERMGVALLEPRKCARPGGRLYLPFAAYVDESLGYKVGGPPEGCPACKPPPAGCVAGWADSINGDWEVPVAAGRGAVTFNDHGYIEKTHLVSAGGGWAVKTNATGVAAGDGRFVYTVSFGIDNQGPVQVMALRQSDGKPAWQTELPGAPTDIAQYTDVAVDVRARWLAARVADRIYVIKLAR